MKNAILRMSIILITTLFMLNIFLSVENVWSEEVIKTIEVGNLPIAVVFNPINNDVYVVNTNSDTISVIDSTTNEVIKTIPLGHFLPEFYLIPAMTMYM